MYNLTKKQIQLIDGMLTLYPMKLTKETKDTVIEIIAIRLAIGAITKIQYRDIINIINKK